MQKRPITGVLGKTVSSALGAGNVGTCSESRVSHEVPDSQGSRATEEVKTLQGDTAMGSTTRSQRGDTALPQGRGNEDGATEVVMCSWDDGDARLQLAGRSPSAISPEVSRPPHHRQRSVKAGVQTSQRLLRRTTTH
jgi:hypothetical protein